jgi:hypothetical protein
MNAICGNADRRGGRLEVRLRGRSIACVGACVCLLMANIGRAEVADAGHPVRHPYSTTTVSYLLAMEISVHRPVSQATQRLAESAIEAATEAAAAEGAKPKDRESALHALGAIQRELNRNNFLQPPREDLWRHTLSEALVPHDPMEKDVAEGLAYHENQSRLGFVDRNRPFYWVDCDMGSLLFVSVGERLGWDIRLAAVPHHNYVMWRVSAAEIVNWDWSSGRSVPDSVYLSRGTSVRHWSDAGVYAVSMSRLEMRGYYLGQIGTKIDHTQEGLALLEQASRLAPKDPSTANNLAWAYATRENSTVLQRDLAITFALQAWAVDPDDANVVDTVACSFAARDEFVVAEVLERRALSGARFEKQRKGFEADRDRITSKHQCAELSDIGRDAAAKP